MARAIKTDRAATARASKPKRESSLHWHVAAMLDTWLPCPPCYFTTFPAGGGGERRGMILKGLGLKAGVPDVLIIYGADPIPPAVRLFVETVAPEMSAADMMTQAAIAELRRATLSPAAYWIELKRAQSGRLNDSQIKAQGLLAACGCKIANCSDIDQVRAALDAWRIPRYVENPRAFADRIALAKVNYHLLQENTPIGFSHLENVSDLA